MLISSEGGTVHGRMLPYILTVKNDANVDVQTAPVQLAFFSQVAVLGAEAMMDSTE